MSKVFKSVGKVFKSATKAVTKTVKSVVKSKPFKAIAGASLIYFGGAGLMAMSSGGTFASGLSSAWTGLSTAGTSLMSGNFAQAGSALKAGFMGTAPGAASVASTVSSVPSMSSGVYNAKLSADAAAIAGTAVPKAAADLAVGAATAPAAAASTGLFGLGEYGTAALVSGGIQTVGGAIAGKAQDKAEKEARDRSTYAGVNNVGGNGLNTQGLFQPMSMNSIAPSTPQWVPPNMDALVNSYRNYGG